MASGGTQRGTPRKRALFGPGCCVSESPIDDVAEAQAGWSAENNLPEWAQSPGVGLADTVAHLQREVEDLCSESMYNHTGKTPIPPQHSRQTKFTSTRVPKFAGTTRWDQYRQVFDAIVISNGWDDATAALQLLSHLEGDALNVALLVPVPRRALPGVLVDALAAHYGSPGRLADYRHQFEKISWTTGSDPSIFAIELET